MKNKYTIHVKILAQCLVHNKCWLFCSHVCLITLLLPRVTCFKSYLLKVIIKVICGGGIQSPSNVRGSLGGQEHADITCMEAEYD